MPNKKKIKTLNDPIAKAGQTLSKGILAGGKFFGSVLKKGFKSYVGTKGIHLTNPNVSGIQSGQVKGRSAPMPGLTGRAKADSTYNANYTKWVGKADPMVATKGDYNYMLKQKKNK